jgi:hypothetical protein
MAQRGHELIIAHYIKNNNHRKNRICTGTTRPLVALSRNCAYKPLDLHNNPETTAIRVFIFAAAMK